MSLETNWVLWYRDPFAEVAEAEWVPVATGSKEECEIRRFKALNQRIDRIEATLGRELTESEVAVVELEIESSFKITEII